ncbi:MarR family winged helix-turn-helix transcriptional regulator [Dactylosporangium sucinum]|uniref:MarR family transcriptional regulator n=1 Tax=Dactylosporangium sucinum TaxID=1424081 RepID=A0A917X5K9_9ACTN|nr:MarR family transcriptional regulator [Dactylosporangium sucinum]GGM71982.1 MarR family transcriptional regulator [Dactylosporangium sucinum]
MRDEADRLVEVWERELDWLDPVAEAIFVRLGLLSRYMAQARRDGLARGGLDHGQFKVLLMLRRLGPPYTTSPSRLAELLGLTRGALSARLAPIEAAGWITRGPGGADRRRVAVRLTEAGSAVFERHAADEGRGEAALLAPLTPVERQTLADLLRKVVAGASSATAGPAEDQPGGSPPAASSAEVNGTATAMTIYLACGASAETGGAGAGVGR